MKLHFIIKGTLSSSHNVYNRLCDCNIKKLQMILALIMFMLNDHVFKVISDGFMINLTSSDVWANLQMMSC